MKEAELKLYQFKKLAKLMVDYRDGEKWKNWM